MWQFGTSAFSTVVWKRKLGEVENECTLHNSSLFAIILPKIIKIGRNLTEFWQKQFLRHGVLSGSKPRCIALTEAYNPLRGILTNRSASVWWQAQVSDFHQTIRYLCIIMLLYTADDTVPATTTFQPTKHKALLPNGWQSRQQLLYFCYIASTVSNRNSIIISVSLIGLLKESRLWTTVVHIPFQLLD